MEPSWWLMAALMKLWCLLFGHHPWAMLSPYSDDRWCLNCGVLLEPFPSTKAAKENLPMNHGLGKARCLNAFVPDDDRTIRCDRPKGHKGQHLARGVGLEDNE